MGVNLEDYSGWFAGIASWVGVSLGGYSGWFAGDSFVGGG